MPYRDYSSRIETKLKTQTAVLFATDILTLCLYNRDQSNVSAFIVMIVTVKLV